MKIKNRYFLRLLFLIVAFSSYSQSDPNNLVFNGNKESIKKIAVYLDPNVEILNIHGEGFRLVIKNKVSDK